MYECNECGKKFTNGTDFENSFGEQVVFTCPSCGKQDGVERSDDGEPLIDLGPLYEEVDGEIVVCQSTIDKANAISEEPTNAALATEREAEAGSRETEGRLPGMSIDSGQTL